MSCSRKEIDEIGGVATWIRGLVFAWRAFLIVKPNEKLGLYGLVAGSGYDIFHKLNRYKNPAPGAILDLARASKGHFGPKSDSGGPRL